MQILPYYHGEFCHTTMVKHKKFSVFSHLFSTLKITSMLQVTFQQRESCVGMVAVVIVTIIKIHLTVKIGGCANKILIIHG